jgi:glycosyltransferase involved in cell wall biosynthesis
LKIAFVVPFLSTGGVETFIFRLSKYLNEHGHEVTVVACNHKGAWWSRLSEMGIKHVFLPMVKSFSAVSHAKTVINYLIINEFDIVFLNNEKFSQAALAYLPNEIAAVPIIHIDADFAYKIGCSNQYDWNVIVGVSPKISTELNAVLPDRAVVEIPYGVELPDQLNITNRETIDVRPLRLLFVGRIEHIQKGVFHLPEILLNCVSSGLDVTLTIVGSGSDEAELITKLKENRLMGYVQFVGSVSPSKVYDYLMAHHILLMPSYFEGLPIIALEAQACCCVPIASMLKGITDATIQDGTTGILTAPGNINEIVSAIDFLYKSPSILKEMGLKGHQRIKEFFSVDIMGSKYLRLMQELSEGVYPLTMQLGRQGRLNFSLFSWRDYLPNVLRRLRWRLRGGNTLEDYF